MCYRLQMRLALKYQIILAPAVVLLMMSLLLGFLQYTYWNLSVARQQEKELKASFVALAEVDMAAQRMLLVGNLLTQERTPDPRKLEHLEELYLHMARALSRLKKFEHFETESLDQIMAIQTELNPQYGFQVNHLESILGELRPHLTALLENLNRQRQEFAERHQEDVDELVARTTYVSIIGLGSAILIGGLLAMAFARRILRRIQILSQSAARVTRGEFSPPPAPDRIHDELDGLAMSINHMTDQLIGVVASEKLIEGAEEERRRIAMDLHDQTLADLASVQRGLEQLTGEEAKRIEADLQRAIANLRVVMDDLHPQTLDILGLGAALESHLEKVCNRSGAPEYFWLADDEIAALPLSRSVQVSLYRIAVEAIQNVLRHSGATRFEVSLVKRESELLLAVEDNGKGFNFLEATSRNQRGRGLHNITERARAIGAKVAWRTSRFSSGTRFELCLPLEDMQGQQPD